MNVSAQANYFVRGSTRGSPYVFAAGGVADASEARTNPGMFGGGAGYRFVVGERLTFRADGRYMHFTDNGGNAVMVGLSIGGSFLRQGEGTIGNQLVCNGPCWGPLVGAIWLRRG